MRTFYAPPSNFTGDNRAVLTGDEARHAVKVLRLREGERIRLVDGHGNAFLSAIVKIVSEHEVHVKIIEKTDSADPQAHIALAVAIPRPQRMDFLVEKAVEIGAAEIYPLVFERTPRRLSGKTVRWRKIAISAMKQCGRASLPTIHEPRNLEVFMDFVGEFESRYVAHLLDGKPLLSYNLSNKAVIAVGPEGGFTEAEMDMLIENGFQKFSLGRRVLRVETAAIVALSLFMAGLGEI